MCSSEDCPLQYVCDARMAFAAEETARVTNENTIALGEFFDEFAEISTNDSNWEIMQMLAGVMASAKEIRETVKKHDEQLEDTYARVEIIRCNGPIVHRKFPWLGSVAYTECGSEPRKARVKRALASQNDTANELGYTDN